VDVSGGQIQGIVGAGSVVIENLTFYSRASEELVHPASAEPIAPCPYPGLAYFGPSDAGLFFGRDAAITRLAEAVGRFVGEINMDWFYMCHENKQRLARVRHLEAYMKKMKSSQPGLLDGDCWRY